MAIEFVCPSCGGTLQVGDDTAGRVIRCGGCMAELRVPHAGGTATTAAPDPYDVDRPAVPLGAARSADPSRRTDSPRRTDPDGPSDRPRRRRPPPPPPPGRGVFFWLVIIGTVMLVGVGLCCGGILLLVPDADWQKHESKDGGFRAQMPARPRANTAERLGINMGKDVRSEGAMLVKKANTHFIVFYRDVPRAKDRPRFETDERLIEKETKALLVAAQANPAVIEKPPTGRPGTVDGFESREIDFAGKAGFYTAKVIAADTRVYVLLGGGGMAQPGDPDVRKFLDSFEITNPELKAEGQRRAERAKKKAEAEAKDRDDPPNPDADGARAAAEAVAGAAVGAVREEIEAQERERRVRAAAEAADARSAAETVAAVALSTALRAARPPLPVAPPPRLIED